MSATPYISHNVEARYEPPEPTSGRVIVSLSEEFARDLLSLNHDAVNTLTNAISFALSCPHSAPYTA